VTEDLGRLMRELGPDYNAYRRREGTAADRLAALWRIGDVLVKAGVDRPHSVGRAVERASGGMIKRMLLGRANKVRLIWDSEDALRRQCEGLTSVTNVLEMLPYFDPQSDASESLGADETNDLVRRMIEMPGKDFKLYLSDFKTKHPHQRVGEPHQRAHRAAETREDYADLIDFIRDIASAEPINEESSRMAVVERTAPADPEVVACLLERILGTQTGLGTTTDEALAVESSVDSPDWYGSLAQLAATGSVVRFARLTRVAGLPAVTLAAGMLRASSNPIRWRTYCTKRLRLGDADD